MMRRWTRRGGVLVTTAFSFLALLLFAGLALDFGRAYLLKAELQTAVDASALAGALQVVPMVAIERDRWRLYQDTCSDPVTGQPYDCSHWEQVTPAKAQGSDRYIRSQGGWRTETASQCASPFRCNDYRIVKTWDILPASTESKALETFNQNKIWPVGGSIGATIETLKVTIDQNKKPEPEVTTIATIRVPTSFLRLVGITELRFTRRGSAQPVRL